MAASVAELESALDLTTEYLHYAKTHKRMFPPCWYDWQLDLFAAGLTHSERLVLAANRSGKTMSAAYEFSLHVTGDYPDDWIGIEVLHDGVYWALGVDNGQVRDVLMKELFGVLDAETGSFTGGWIHPDEVKSVIRSQTPGLAKEVVVHHKFGGFSHVSFKTYTQSATGQKSLPFAGASVDGCLVDEQPPDSITGQLKTRTMTGRRGKGGFLLYSMTPELGETELVRRFMGDPAAHQYLVGPIAWTQCPHLTPEIQAEMLSSIPLHERDMRSRGIPMFGSGRIFATPEEDIVCKPFNLSDRPWIKCVRSMDLGIGHPTAISWMCYDPEEGITYLVRTHRQADKEAAVHASTANSLWPNAPVVFPPDIDGREKGSGKTVREWYALGGLTNSVDFENPDGSHYVEPGIMALIEGESNGTFKVFEGRCDHYLEERRSYHRDERGAIVKERDDTIDSVRYGFQMVGTAGVLAEQRTRPDYGSMAPELGLRRVDTKLRRPRGERV